MRVFLVNIGIILAILLAYYLDIFSLFANKYALPVSIGLVAIVLAAALKVLGSPFKKGKKEDDDETK